MYHDEGSPTANISTIPQSFAKKGWNLARCVALVELGTIHIHQNKWQRQVRLTWELPLDLRNYVKEKPDQLDPKLVSKEYAASLYNKSHLKAALKTWLGEKVVNELESTFDPFQVVGEPCQIHIGYKRTSNNKWYEDVEQVYALNKPMQCPQITPSKILTFNSWDWDVFNSLPAYVQNKIIGSREFVQRFGHRDPVKEKKSFNDLQHIDNEPPPF